MHQLRENFLSENPSLKLMIRAEFLLQKLLTDKKYNLKKKHTS